MHLMDLLARRPVPAAGVFLTLTRRCPLTCAHCSTNSMRTSEEHAAGIFTGFAASFTREDHPEIVLLTGGEPLLRPDVVVSIARSAREVGAATQLISGFYFARPDGAVAPRLMDALLAVDHVTVSLDVFHEMQVSRAATFATIRSLLDAGQDVSIQLVGRGAKDPYLAEVTTEIREIFDERVPALVAPLGSVGRAKLWLDGNERHYDEVPVPSPCALSAWPVVTFDGTVVACCNQAVVDGPAPPHLRLGRAPTTTWAETAATVRDRPILRALRTLGPRMTAQSVGTPSGPDYCGACVRLSDRPRPEAPLINALGGKRFAVVEAEVLRMQSAAGPESFARRYGIAEYAHMVTLGYDGRATP